MMSKAVDVAAGGGGACRAGAKSNCGAPTSVACHGWSSSSELGLRGPPPSNNHTHDYRGDEHQRWRNPAFSESYFDSVTKSGDARSTVWRLSRTQTQNGICGRCGGKALRFELAVAANGTITELLFNGAPLAPLQWKRHKSEAARGV